MTAYFYLMRTLVVTPTYNERKNIAKFLECLLKIDPNLHILVVDDNSPDGTGHYVKEVSNTTPRVHLIQRPRKLGLGSAYKVGFEYAVKNGYDVIIQMDADFSHNPNDIRRFIDAIKEADVVLGSRYINGVRVINWPITRLLLSYFANLYARYMTGLPFVDLTSGFKCYRRKVLESLPWHHIKTTGYGFQIETLFWAYCKRFKIKEIPIVFTERSEGSSKMTKKIIWEAFWLVNKLLLYRVLRKVK